MKLDIEFRTGYFSRRHISPDRTQINREMATAAQIVVVDPDALSGSGGNENDVNGGSLLAVAADSPRSPQQAAGQRGRRSSKRRRRNVFIEDDAEGATAGIPSCAFHFLFV